MSDYVCETCSEEARFVFVSLDTVVSAACEEHRQPVVQRLVQLAFEPAHLAAGVKWADLAQLRVEDYSVGMTVPTFEGPRDVPRASPGLERAVSCRGSTRTSSSCRGNLFGVGDARDILETHVTHTIVAGRVVHRAEV